MNEFDQQLASSDWCLQGATNLLSKYRNAKTEHERNRLLPKMAEMYGRMQFQARELKKYIPDEQKEGFTLE